MITQVHKSEACWAVSALCILCLVACSPNKPTISGNLSSNDVAQINQVVREGLLLRFHEAKGRPIKSITATTNWSYDFYTRWRSEEIGAAQTNGVAKRILRDIETNLSLLAKTETNAEAEVWYADNRARWGEAGFLLEKGTNGWRIAVELSR